MSMIKEKFKILANLLEIYSSINVIFKWFWKTFKKEFQFIKNVKIKSMFLTLILSILILIQKLKQTNKNIFECTI